MKMCEINWTWTELELGSNKKCHNWCFNMWKSIWLNDIAWKRFNPERQPIYLQKNILKTVYSSVLQFKLKIITCS